MESKHKTIRSTDCQNNFGAYLKRVNQSTEPVFIEKHGKTCGVLLSFHEWQKLNSEKPFHKSAFLQKCDAFAESIQVKQTSSTQLLKELRDETS